MSDDLDLDAIERRVKEARRAMESEDQAGRKVGSFWVVSDEDFRQIFNEDVPALVKENKTLRAKLRAQRDAQG